MEFQVIPVKDLSRGIDAYNSENSVADGYCEDLLNVDTPAGAYLAKRSGYQGHCGRLPMRATRLKYAAGGGYNIEVTFDNSIDLSQARPSPVVVYGKTSVTGGGDFSPANSCHYYDSSKVKIDAADTMAAGTGVTVTKLGIDHGFATDKLFLGLLEATSITDQSNKMIMPDSVSIDTVTKDVTWTYTTATALRGYLLVADKNLAVGQSYTQDTTVGAPGAVSIGISAATHLLSNFSILAKVYLKTGGTTWTEVLPDYWTINSSGGVTVYIDAIAAGDYRIILSSTDSSSYKSDVVASGATTTSAITGVTSPFNFVQVFAEDLVTGLLTSVFPDEISYNAATQVLSVTATNYYAAPVNIKIIYEAVSAVANKLFLAGGASSAYTDTAPQLTLWGLPHSGSHISGAAPGHVTHIDSYRREGEERIIAGIGGTLYSAQTYAEASSTYKLPELLTNIRTRASGTQVLGPAFFSLTASPATSRGYIQGSNISGNYALTTAAAYNSVSGYTDYTLSIADKVVSTSVGAIILITEGKEDWLTVTGTSHSRLDGTFKIKSFVENVSTIVISVENDSITSSDYNDNNMQARAGIFTDHIKTTSTLAPFLPEDQLVSSLFADTDLFYATSVLGTNVTASGFTSEFTVPNGTLLAARRTSSVVPLRNNTTFAATVDNFVAGDMCEVTDLARQVRIVSVNTQADVAASISSDGTVATVTVADTSQFAAGSKYLLHAANSQFQRVIEVVSIVSSTVFTFACTEIVLPAKAVSATILALTVHIDEELIFEDGDSPTVFTVAGRWIPIEAPTIKAASTLPKLTHSQYFDSAAYDSQATLRSAMVSDNMYFLNGDDELMKFDGTSVYKAGLFRWQPQLFITYDTAVTAKKLVYTPQTALYSAAAGNIFTIPSGERVTFTIGDRITDDDGKAQYTIVDLYPDATGLVNDFVLVDRDITGGAGAKIDARTFYRYYFRLNAIDANSNVVASAVTGNEDFLLYITESGTPNLRLVGMPAFDNYDYDRIELEVYRTHQGTVSPFYRVATKVLDFAKNSGYIDVLDVVTDSTLQNKDEVNTSLKENELGVGWDTPLRGSYLTSIDNKLVIAKLRGYPTLSAEFRHLATIGTILTSGFVASGESRYLLRRANTDTGTATNMVDRAGFEFRSTGSVAIATPATKIVPTTSTFSVDIAAGHGVAAAGDWVYLFHSAATATNSLRFAGWWQVAVRNSATVFTVNYTNSGAAAVAEDVNCLITATAKTDIPVWLGTDGNYQYDGGNVSATSDASAVAIVRLTNAINSVMRLTDVTLTGQTAFAPWVTAHSGSEFGLGVIELRRPEATSEFMELVMPASTGTSYSVYVNGLPQIAGEQSSAVVATYPNRVAVSYSNYPEMMDNQTVDLAQFSDSIQDINRSDGQEITGVIPFFAESTFTAAARDSFLVVFKNESIYLMNMANNTNSVGRPTAVSNRQYRRIDSQGLGCTAPYSICATRGGIMFANNSGIYRMGRDTSITYVGKFLSSKWITSVNRDALAAATGTNFAVNNVYKLSVPVNTDEVCSEVYVYDHTDETPAELGSWVRYNNHPATGWANLGTSAYFGDTAGNVFVLRQTGDQTDYRDDAAAISAVITDKARDFGIEGSRKILQAVVHHLKLSTNFDVLLESAIDLRTDYETTATISAVIDNPDTLYADFYNSKIISLKSPLLRRKFQFLQLRYSNAVKDQGMVLVSMDFVVARLSSKGIKSV